MDNDPVDKNPGPLSESFAAVDAWFFGMLRRELELKGAQVTAKTLRSHLKLRTVQGETDGSNRNLKLKLCQHLTKCAIRLNARTAETISWFVDFIATGGDRSMSREDAIDTAAKVMALPENAKLVHAEYEESGGHSVFRARWAHDQDGLPVEGDYIEVLINGKNRRPFSYNRVWRSPNLSARAEEK